ncbi:hypothetical protein [Pseudonocardia phyllosphaerae]|uniref:hypothetical protein n=1 Tax=Pseudonocardia phyllosphaerae TaxID=3390502 RepID=UPI00397DEDD3
MIDATTAPAPPDTDARDPAALAPDTHHQHVLVPLTDQVRAHLATLNSTTATADQRAHAATWIAGWFDFYVTDAR